MTTPAPELPPWVQPYEPDFRELLRQLDLVPGFIFQPVVLPSPDLARELANWLARQGVAVRVFDMRHEPWDELAVHLRTLTFDPSLDRRGIVVITPANLDRAAISDGLAAFNFSRDSIARNLQCPLLWCGDVELLRTTAELASDFWSIAATVYRIPLRALSDAPPTLGFPRVWWTGAASEGIDQLAARLATARAHGDRRQIAQTSLALAEANLAHGQRSDAAELLAEVETIVRSDAPSLYLRWHALDVAARSDAHGYRDAMASLRTHIAQAHARGAVEVEASLYESLARLAYLAGQEDEAISALLAARSLYHRTGDDDAAIVSESHLVSYLHRLPGDVIADIRAQVQRASGSSSSLTVRGVASWILAELAFRDQRWDEADDAASMALHGLHADDPARIRVLALRRHIAGLRQDWRAALSLDSERLALALAHDDLQSAADAHRSRAAARMALDQVEDACRDLVAGHGLAVKLGDKSTEISAEIALTVAALRLGVPHIASVYLLRALEFLVSMDGPMACELIELASELVDDEVSEIVDRSTRDHVGKSAAIAKLAALREARELELAARGIELHDVSTWTSRLPVQVAPEGS